MHLPVPNGAGPATMRPKFPPLRDIPDLAEELAHLGGQYVAYSRVLDELGRGDDEAPP